jgi:small subunit ribosomal protein S20
MMLRREVAATRSRCETLTPRYTSRRLMANIHSQKKRILRAERERLENRRYTSTIKTYFRRLEAAVTAGDDETADTEHRQLVRTIDKAVKRGALHRNSGARKKSRAAKVRVGAGASE